MMKCMTVVLCRRPVLSSNMSETQTPVFQSAHTDKPNVKGRWKWQNIKLLSVAIDQLTANLSCLLLGPGGLTHHNTGLFVHLTGG